MSAAQPYMPLQHDITLVQQEIDEAHAAALAAIQPQLDAVMTKIAAAQAAGTPLSPSWLYERARLQTLSSTIQTEIDGYARSALNITKEMQVRSIQTGLGDTTNQLRAQLSSTLGGDLASVKPVLGLPSMTALHELIGAASNGTPLDALFQGFGAEAAQGARSALISGLALGTNPRVVGNSVAQALDMSRNRGQVIARQEMISAYRDAQQLTMQANSDVVAGWVWIAALGSACICCTDMDGSIHPIDEDMVSHIQCRCSMGPLTRSYADILNGAPEELDLNGGDALLNTSLERQPGAQWFEQQPASVQRDILGPAKFEAWSQGDIANLSDLIGYKNDPAWGPSMYEKSLKELGLDAQDYLHPIPFNFDDQAVRPFASDLPGGSVRPFAHLPNVDGITAQLEDRWPGLNVEFAGLPPDSANSAASAFDAVMERWPQLAERLDTFGVDVGPDAERYLGLKPLPGNYLAGADPNGRYLFINGSRWFDMADLQAGLTKDVARGWIAAGMDSPEYVVTHEMGHLLEAWIRTDPERAAALDEFMAANANLTAGLGKMVDGAADEAFAQAFAANELGILSDDPYVQAQRDFIDQLLTDHPGTGPVESPFPGEGSDRPSLRPMISDANTLTREGLADKNMAELRQIAREMDVTPARTKAETVDRILAKQAEKVPAPILPAAPEVTDPMAALRAQVDDKLAQRELLYGQQADLREAKFTVKNAQNDAAHTLRYAEMQAKQDLYRASLDQADPKVKQYFKDRAAYQKATTDKATAHAEQQRLTRVMDRLSIQGKQGSAEYAQARADYQAAEKAFAKSEKAASKAYDNVWTKSPGVYKPELDSIAGFDMRMARKGVTFTQDQIANAPSMIAAQEKIAALPGQLRDIQAQIDALGPAITDANAAVDQALADLKDLTASLGDEAKLVDTMQPFSGTIDLPEGHQPPNALMNKIDYRMQEPRAVTKSRIIDDISTRLQDNPAWQDYMDRMPMPDRLGVYHDYIDWHADPADSRSQAYTADLIKKWGVGYKPGSPQWVAMQMATRDEFGLDAAIHVVSDAGMRAGEAYYAENGDALRVFLRAMYDNTQQWFADNGITEVDVYRGYGWTANQWQDGRLVANANVPGGITWGPIDSQAYGTTDLELNPMQSFSADINISQGTGVGNGFAGAGFSGGSDYSLLIGARVPVERVLSTAQTGFGAKLESEVVVMGRLTDTVAYRAGTTVEEALLRDATETALDRGGMLYALEDGTQVSVTANADGTFTVSYIDGPQAKLGTLKAGGSKTYKTASGVNKFLRSQRIRALYVGP